ncbi:hypothetical protein IMW82_17075 [Rhodanobacter sp. B2A1Ga4]|uniref:hypothetical protein n=1 Tax=Rhodanobacter sp. B2A1Ga4 TaxID=2778647 RepID=UPI001B392177|nr:hypothetical protein [Rhodanobacter sp. B2A1Ga4]MBQ4856383.1 hypothetical protein [Rhodanobacter sp. B2A1Ga4]
MKPMLKTLLVAYRPLYLNGLLLDGPYRLPKVGPTVAAAAPRARRRTLLAALASVIFHPRSK